MIHMKKLFGIVIFISSLFAGEPNIVSAKNINGKTVSFFNDTKNLATVFIFITTDCPIANSYSPEIKRIHDAFNDDSVEIALIMSIMI